MTFRTFSLNALSLSILFLSSISIASESPKTYTIAENMQAIQEAEPQSMACKQNEDCDFVELGCYYWQPVNKNHSEAIEGKYGAHACLASMDPGAKPVPYCLNEVCVSTPEGSPGRLFCDGTEDCTSIVIGCDHWQPVNVAYADQYQGCRSTFFNVTRPDVQCVDKVCTAMPDTQKAE